MRSLHNLSLILLSLAMTSEAAAQDALAAGAQIPAATLARDFGRVKAALIEGAAGLHRYRTKAEVAQTFAEVDSKLTRPMTAIEFWRVITPALASFGDGHMVVMLDRQQLLDYLDGRRFPLRFRIVDNRLYVTGNLSDTAISNGSEIVSINGVPAGELISRCGAFIPADGGLPMRRLRKVEREFAGTCIPALDLGSNFDLVIRQSDGKAARLQLAGLDPERAQSKSAPAQARQPQPAPSFYKIEIPPGQKVATLTLGSFVRSSQVNPAEGFAKAFADVERAGVTDLILDMRGSAGGRDSDGALLYSYLAVGDFRYVEARIANRDHFIAQGNSEALNAMVAQIPHATRPDGRIVLSDALDGIQQPQPQHRFGGRVYLIVDGNTFSTGSEFATVFKHYRRGPVIGEETGTAAAGGSGGPATLRLPDSGIAVDVPLVEYIMPGAEAAERGRGVQPDHPIDRTMPDRLTGTDRAMAKAMELVADAQGSARSD